MILHTGYFCERYRTALFLPFSDSLYDSDNDNGNANNDDDDDDDDDDDETDLVVSHSPFFYWQLLTAASRHWTTSVNDVHITVILS